jgi:hypothetical protein
VHAQANAAAPTVAPPSGAEWRARLEASHRAEAAMLAAAPPWQKPRSEAEETGQARPVPGRCPRCRAAATVGVTVVIRHLPGCAVAAVTTAARARARGAGGVPCPPASITSAAPCASAVPGPRSAPTGQAGRREVRAPHAARDHDPRDGGRSRDRRRQRGRVYTCASAGPRPEPQHRVRPWVVARWFVSGARVWAWVADAGGWMMATARRIIRDRGGRLRVRLDLDSWVDRRPYLISDLEPVWAGAR